mgnify:CR=1 FL=1
MELFKVAVSFDDNGNTFIADGLEYQGAVWIVPKWLNYPTEGNRKPERIIRLQKDETQHAPNSSICLYSAKYPLPASLLSALNQSQIPEGYAVQFLPDLAFAIQS